ncbi:sensor histidine kinase [Amycolatopsis thermophila]|uniref:histidine kinase n=1 Tax=Amycolatopsis thermophila TaxID=206084 RepID=A0ABU0F0L9_9PSEU|nr:sensor histidine kinase [Amycolatopsis thermophila]MDQ0381056.1 signal transduction histidine kinase [Amycolatopsis thermophila]
MEQEPDWGRWQRPAPTPRQQRHDVALMLLVLLVAAGMTLLITSIGTVAIGSAPSLTEQLAWTAGLTVPLALRRRFPLVVLAVVGALFIAAQMRQIGDGFMPSVVLFLAIYSAGAWARHRARARWARVAVIVAMFAWLGIGLVRYAVAPGHPPNAAGPLDPLVATVLYQIVFNLMFFLSAYFFGDLAWRSARGRAELTRRAEQLRASQEQNARGAIVAERVRIARDLHDVVAHHVSVMGIQASAARRVLDRDRELAGSALRTVEDTARTAISELRGLLGVLRAEPDAEGRPDAGHQASPGLAQLPALAAATRSAGLDVHYGEYGDPRPVPDSVAMTAYRIAQEALTNVVKHSGARSAQLRVRFLEAGLEIEVSDDGRGCGGDSTPAGFGLRGMRERVAVHGGELEAGPRRDGGFLVRASLPAPRPATSDSAELPVP